MTQTLRQAETEAMKQVGLEPSAEPSGGRTLAAQLEAVSKRRGDKPVLKGVDLALYEGEVLALLGANGVGKSTLVALLLGLLRPDAGRVQVFGRDPSVPQHRARTGVMLQQNALPHNLTVRETLNLFRNYYPRARALDDLLVRAQLQGLERRQVQRLSGGQARRVAFAAALAGDPDLLVLDEPTTGLDLSARRALWGEVRALAEAGKTVLLTTHYLEEADALADRVVLLHAGEIIAEGTPETFKRLSAPTSPQAEGAKSLEEAFLALTETAERSRRG